MRKLGTLLLALVCVAGGLPAPESAAQNQACLRHFVDGKAPSFTRASLQQKTAGLCFEAFAVMHSGVSPTPLWSAEHLTRDSLAAAKTVPRKDAFHAEETLPPELRAELSDYARSGYDRGHISPAADMPTEQAQHQSFSLANIVPQNRENNQVLWSAIEGATRHLTLQRGQLYVMTGPVFEGERIERINSRVFVPTHVYKAVYDPVRKEGAAWIAPNAAGNAYEVITIAALEKRIGINLFPAVDSAVKDKAMALPEPRIRGRKPAQP